VAEAQARSGEGLASSAVSAGYEGLTRGLAALPLAIDVVSVSGEQAGAYLQGQLSQDISGLEVGECAWSLVLQPQGRLVALVRVYRRSGEEFLLVTDAGVGQKLVERLNRFLLRTKAVVEQLPWRSVAVRGPLAHGRTGDGPGANPASVRGHEGASVGPVGSGVALEASLAVPFEWGPLVGYDLVGASPAPPPGAVAASAADYEAVRIEAGFPRHGAELDERTIPAEAGIVEASVSFTKGCYTGQELVARIDSRGSHVPRRLHGLALEASAEPGTELLEAPSAGAKVVGKLTSTALSPRLGWVALAYTARGVHPGQALWASSGERLVACEVRALPMAQ